MPTRRKTNGRVPANLSYYKPTRNAKGSMGAVSGGASADADHLQYTHALVNPFAAEAKGVKLPDDDSTRSVAFQLRWGHSLNTDANGRLACAVEPEPQAAAQSGNSITASSVATWNTASTAPNATEVAAAFSKYRIVSWGVRIIPLLAPTDQSGYVRVITTHDDPTGAAFVTQGGFFEEVHDYPVANADIHWVSKPVGNAYKQYIGIGSRASWETLVVWGTGLPASTNNAVRLEIVFNMEAEMAFGSITGAISTPAADHNPRVLAAADHARNRSRNAHDGGKPTLLGRLWGAAKEGLIAAASTYGTPLLGAAARAVLGRVYQPRAIAAPTTRAIEVD